MSSHQLEEGSAPIFIMNLAIKHPNSAFLRKLPSFFACFKKYGLLIAPLSAYVIQVVMPCLFLWRFYWRFDLVNTLEHWCIAACYLITAVLCCWSHFTAMTGNPGYASVNNAEIELTEVDSENQGREHKPCLKCGAFKVEGVHHCSTCGRCVHLMDHHCGWIGNCVGRDNMKAFTLFCFYATCFALT